MGQARESSRNGNVTEKEATNLLLSPFTAVTRVGSSLSLVRIDLGTSHDVWSKMYVLLCRLLCSHHKSQRKTDASQTEFMRRKTKRLRVCCSVNTTAFQFPQKVYLIYSGESYFNQL